MPKPKIVAFHLPQFHRVPENDKWWGEGFTEWNNVRRGLPLFRGHHQPHVPAQLGYYDLLDPAVRAAQADLARAHGVDAFCYYHYWFHGKRLLEKPVESILESGTPDFPFCLCWANDNWTRVWDGDAKSVLMEQSYSREDDEAHIAHLLRTFKDPRYLRCDGRPVFAIYRASKIPGIKETLRLWRHRATQANEDPLFLRVESLKGERGDPAELGFDGSIEFQPDWETLGVPANLLSKIFGKLTRRHVPTLHEYDRVADAMMAKPDVPWLRFPGVTPSWDNTSRKANRGLALRNPTPAKYKQWLQHALERARRLDVTQPYVFVNAWNEWSEGCHLEPDSRFGMAWLESTRQATRSIDER